MEFFFSASMGIGDGSEGGTSIERLTYLVLMVGAERVV